MQFLARYYIWSAYTGSTYNGVIRRRYWAAAASLHYYFRDTLTYRFNAEHHSHIHVDNGQSGTDKLLTTFSTGSGTQVQAGRRCPQLRLGLLRAQHGLERQHRRQPLRRGARPRRLWRPHHHQPAPLGRLLQFTCQQGTAAYGAGLEHVSAHTTQIYLHCNRAGGTAAAGTTSSAPTGCHPEDRVRSPAASRPTTACARWAAGHNSCRSAK